MASTPVALEWACKSTGKTSRYASGRVVLGVLTSSTAHVEDEAGFLSVSLIPQVTRDATAELRGVIKMLDDLPPGPDTFKNIWVHVGSRRYEAYWNEGDFYGDGATLNVFFVVITARRGLERRKDSSFQYIQLMLHGLEAFFSLHPSIDHGAPHVDLSDANVQRQWCNDLIRLLVPKLYRRLENE